MTRFKFGMDAKFNFQIGSNCSFIQLHISYSRKEKILLIARKVSLVWSPVFYLLTVLESVNVFPIDGLEWPRNYDILPHQKTAWNAVSDAKASEDSKQWLS
jgi:hypothetical protein